MGLEHLIHTIGATTNLPDMDRRKFLQTAGVAAGAGILGGCATNSGTNRISEKGREYVDSIEWDCNPILPIPKDGCYTGTNQQFLDEYAGLFAASEFEDLYGKKPVLMAPGVGTFHTFNEWFPSETKPLLENGVASAIRYITMTKTNNKRDYHGVLKGDYDDKFKKFAHAAAKVGGPVVLLPWQCVNEPNWGGQVWEWSRADPEVYKAAWVRMHEIMNREGATNLVWSTKMISGGFGRYSRATDWAKYTPPPDYVDIIGWNVNEAKTGRSFRSLFQNNCARATELYPKKPQVLWELGASKNWSQHKWMDKALKMIKNQYGYVKGIMFDVMYSRPGQYDPRHTLDTIKVCREHFAAPYFIGNILQVRT
jgi:hypothetical protein